MSMSSSMLCSPRRNNKDGDGEPQIIISTPASMRKGPWTDEEDEQLVRFVRLFGERRWDFLAKVSGLRRTGKSCRLRWVNYLHPGLRRGRITADEERRIVELHAQWGSRWSRIARSLPGRTDNEIKNFWRTRTRKKALEDRRAAAAGAGGASATTATAEEPPASSSSSVTTTTTTSEFRPGSSSSPTSGAATTTSSSSGDDDVDVELEEASTPTAAPVTKHEQQQPQEYYDDGCSSMDQLWNEIAAADAAAAMGYLVGDACWGGAAGHYYYGDAADPPPASPPWEYCGSDFSLWRIDDQEYYS